MKQDGDVRDGTVSAASAAATHLLERAQRVADELHEHAQQELTETTARSEALKAESLRLHEEAAAKRAEAVRASAGAQARLEEATHEAQQLVADAADQSTC